MPNNNDDTTTFFGYIDLMSAIAFAFLLLLIIGLYTLSISNNTAINNKAEMNNLKEEINLKNGIIDSLNQIVIPKYKTLIIPNELKDKVFFSKGSFQIRREFYYVLDNYVDSIKYYINNNIFDQVQVCGHTDIDKVTSGYIKDNWDLGALRATEVIRYLISNGINPKYLSASSYSKYRPIDPNFNESSKQKNRRIEIIMQKLEYH